MDDKNKSLKGYWVVGYRLGRQIDAPIRHN
jgi:hypothetical protein